MGFARYGDILRQAECRTRCQAFLPDNWTGGLTLLVVVFVFSAFLDNIAAALVGGTMARHVFRGKVHIGYLAAIVAASNAGGPAASLATPPQP